MADEGAPSADKKSGDSKIKPLILIAAAIVVAQASLTYVFIVQPLQQQRSTAEETRAEAGAKGTKDRKAAGVKPGEPAAEAGDIEIKDLVININPQGGGAKSYLSVNVSLEYKLSKAEVKAYKDAAKARGGEGGGEGGEAKVFEKAERTKIVDKVIEFFSSKPESELIAGGAARRQLRRELRHTLNWIINHPNAEEPPPLTVAPSAATEGGQDVEAKKGKGGESAREEGSPHPITEIYFTNFVMQ